MAIIPGYYTIEEAAEYLGIHRSQVSRYISSGRLKAIDLGHQKVLARKVVEGFEKPPMGNPNFLKRS